MVSVCLTTHNGEKFILKQIKSITSQLGNDDELIISDDNSTDNTLGIINSICDKRIKIYNFASEYPKEKRWTLINHRISFNFLNAINHSKGDIILFSDQDDIWLDNKIETIKASLKEKDLVISNFSIIDENDVILKKKFYSNFRFIYPFWLYALSPHFTGCAMGFKRWILDIALPFPNEISCGHDNWIGLCAMKFGKIGYIPEPLFMHRVHSSNNSFLAKKSSNSFLMKLNWRLCAFFAIIMRKGHYE